MEEISLRELFFILRKWMMLIISLFTIAVVVSGIVSYYILNPEYQTFTTLMVGKPKDYQMENKIDYNDLILNQKLVSTYGEIVKSRIVTDKVIENLGLDLSYNTFRDKVSVNLVKDTEIIKIQVTDQEPTLAADIANETAKVFMDSVKSIMKVENIQVIDEAQIPDSPVKPRPMLNMAIAGVLGLMSGIFLAFLLEFLDNTIKTSDDVEKHLELPVLGAIPIVRNEESQLISITNPKSPVSEAFRTLRTNIQFSSIDRELKTIIVTSSSPTEGKSTISANLASILAQSDRKVLLIDCDFRKPKVHQNFGLSNLQGITNVLMGDKNISDVVHKYESLDNFNILTSGPIPPNPAELLGSKKMRNLLESLKEDYDTIILDTPPVGLVTDSAVLSTIADGLIYVTAVGQIDVEVIKRAKELLDKVSANIIGVVLNKVPIEGRSYYKYQYYNYYGEDDNGGKKKRSAKA
ncbi:polysaccharide biosynthesis tyrosine autokinase [Tissierella praeacuta]|uniref:polysaccharide biosynthesis tyrosine autokinase n=1 Tax=Tissierella praeacuta TaxID=43131 RepID=UPI00333FB7FF